MTHLVLSRSLRCGSRTLSLLLVLSGLLAVSSALRAQAGSARTTVLSGGWSLASAARVAAGGETLSTGTYRPRGWMRVTVPTTVVAAMVAANRYPDPTFGMNLRGLPGMDYPVSDNFSKYAMTPASPFATSWWYRTLLPAVTQRRGEATWLHFKGINYRANIWVNGHRIADTQAVAGAWRHYDFNITGLVRPGAANALAVQVFAPTENDLAITYVDWNPMPPDKNMGLFREVSLSTSGPATVRDGALIAHVAADGSAQLDVVAELRNATDAAVRGVLRGRLAGAAFAQNVSLAPGEAKQVLFKAADYPQLRLQHPALWWPAQMGVPHLTPLHLELAIGGAPSDAFNAEVGIREITSEVTSPTRRLFRINGKPLLIRGGGWSTDFLLRQTPERLADELNYVQAMGLNTIRLEGRPETDAFFRETDRRGILVMAGWSCCDFWEQWPKWTDEDRSIAAASLRAQMLRLRGHPSLLMWFNGSDNAPPPAQETAYLAIEQELLWPNPILSSATAKLGAGGAGNGARMTGPYDYVPPSYWLADKAADQPGHTCDLGGCGGAHGFNTETSPGPAPPPIESLRTMLGDSHLWPMDSWWTFHAGGGEFKDLGNFTGALTARYGAPRDAEDYAGKSQLMAYEGIRAMFEAYSRNKYESTGVIQWMLNNSWPSMIWHLYDYYLRPGGGYFGAKLALEPLHPLYSSDDGSIWAISSRYTDAMGLNLEAAVYNEDMTQRFSRTVALDLPADSTKRLFALPAISALSPVYFLKLTLRDASGAIVGSNFYWLSTAPETLDWGKSNWYTTPVLASSDFTALSRLPSVHLDVQSRTETSGSQSLTHVALYNPSRSLAFFVRMKVDKGEHGAEVLPVLWDDNYISLLPGERRTVTAVYKLRDLHHATPAVEVNGWNVH